jgi:hypothetical protein
METWNHLEPPCPIEPWHQTKPQCLARCHHSYPSCARWIMASHRTSKDFNSPSSFFVRIIMQEHLTLECRPMCILESLECIMRTIISMCEFYGLIRLSMRPLGSSRSKCERSILDPLRLVSFIWFMFQFNPSLVTIVDVVEFEDELF